MSLAKNTVLFLLTGSVIFALTCQDINVNPFVNKDVNDGYELSKIYCKSCHQYPDAGLLDKKTWAFHVLPKMASMMGFIHFETGGYAEMEVQSLKLDQWKKIVKYYISASPKELPQRKNLLIKKTLASFSTAIPSFRTPGPVSTLVKVDPVNHGFVMGDGRMGRVYVFSKELKVTDSFKVDFGISDLVKNSLGSLVLSMGVLHPSDEKQGTLKLLNPARIHIGPVLDSLQRPVHATCADINADGRADIIVAEFGNRTGNLSWYENVSALKYTKHILRALPGSVRTEVADLNHDGLPDIVALLAQGDEGIFIYYNMGKGNFREEQILRLPPSYGSNYFELADFNHDGFQDIIATNGDNGDYPPILKSYHGIRIYLNDRLNHFKETLFLPVNGVGKVMARDFDEDGDLDLASIAYFPDFERSPEEAFIYWENKGHQIFEPSSFKDVSTGRWLTMDSDDIDGDGDIDIVLGNTFFPLGNVPGNLKKRWAEHSPSVVVLKNNLR